MWIKSNIGIGDICLLKDPHAYRGEGHLCEATAVYCDECRRVRTVQVKVKSCQSGRGHYVVSNSIHLNCQI